MEDRVRVNAKLVFTVLFISQVCGTPTFWIQPDCYQQFSGSGYDNYNSYQTPSYQQTLQSMVEDTLRAIGEIVEITVSATKQHLIDINKVFYTTNPGEDCDPSSGSSSSDTPQDFQFSNSPTPMMQFPAGNEFTNNVQPQDESPQIDIRIPTTTEKEMSTPDATRIKTDKKNNTVTVPLQSNTIANILSQPHPMLTSANNQTFMNNPTSSANTSLSNSTVAASNTTASNQLFPKLSSEKNQTFTNNSASPTNTSLSNSTVANSNMTAPVSLFAGDVTTLITTTYQTETTTELTVTTMTQDVTTKATRKAKL